MDQNELKCKEHQGNAINFVCVSQTCDKPRFGCFQCIQNVHVEHVKQIKEFATIQQDISKCSSNSDIIIATIDDFLNSAFRKITKIKEQLVELKQKFSKFPNGLTLSDITIVIDEVIQYSQGKYEQMLKNVNQFISELKTTINQGSEIFESKQLEEDQYFNEDQQALLIELNFKAITLEIIYFIFCVFEQDKNEECLKILEEILKINPKDLEALQMKGIQLYSLGAIFHNSYQTKQSIPIYEYLVKQQPENHLFLFNLTKSYRRGNNFQKGLESVERLLKMVPNHFDYLEIKGDCLKNLNQFSEALPIFLELEGRDGLNPQIKQGLAEVLCKLGNIQQAIEYHEQAILYGHPNFEGIQKQIDFLRKL